MWLTNIFCCHGNGFSGLNMCATFTVLCTSITYSYGLKRGIIACGHLTNMQDCHGNRIGGLYVCAEYHG